MLKIILPILLLAPAASAQVTTILPGGQGNLLIGTPTNLPGPLVNPVIDSRISLPAPLLTPAITVSYAPTMTPVLAAAVVSLPAMRKDVPAIVPFMPKANFPGHPVALAMTTLKAAATPEKPGDAKTAQKLDERFDGRQTAKKDAVELPGSRDVNPINRGRHYSLPEQDLEAEIGAY